MFKNNKIIRNLSVFENTLQKHKSYGLSYPSTQTLFILDPCKADKHVYEEFADKNSVKELKYLVMNSEDNESHNGMHFESHDSLGFCFFSINTINRLNGLDYQTKFISITDSSAMNDKTSILFIGDLFKYESIKKDKKEKFNKDKISYFLDNLDILRGFPNYTPVFDSTVAIDRKEQFTKLDKIFPSNSFLKEKINKSDYFLNVLAEHQEINPIFRLEQKHFSHLVDNKKYSKLDLFTLFLELNSLLE